MAESKEKNILARIFCLKQDTAYDDDCCFQEFWGKVKGCKIHKNDTTKKFTQKELNKKLHELKNEFQKEKYKCLVLAISSHGIEQEDIQGDNCNFEIRWSRSGSKESFPVNDLLKIFDDDIDIRNKNKIFLMQMCRNRSDQTTVAGSGLNHGVMCRSEPNLPLLSRQDSSIAKSKSSLHLGDIPWPKTWKLAQPCIVNSIVFFSATSGFISHTKMYSMDGGGWLFLCMKKVLKELTGQEISIIHLFLMVNKEMSQMETVNEAYVGMSSFNHMLTDNICIEIKSGS